MEQLEVVKLPKAKKIDKIAIFLNYMAAIQFESGDFIIYDSFEEYESIKQKGGK